MQQQPLTRFWRFGPCFAVACLLAGSLGCSPAAVDQPSRLNVLLITADDLGLQLSSYGDPVIETPNLDALGSSGVLFEVAYVAQASCSPSRSAMFTGLYVHSNGQFGLTNASDFSLHPHLHDATMPNILKRAGYRTGIIGKLHVDPVDRFQWDMRSPVDARDVAAMASDAEEFMSGGPEDPFFLMVNYTDPHAYRERDPETGGIIGDWTFPGPARGHSDNPGRAEREDDPPIPGNRHSGAAQASCRLLQRSTGASMPVSGCCSSPSSG